MVSYQIIIPFVNNANTSEDKNHGIAYKMATFY